METWGDWRRDWLIALCDEMGYEMINWPLVCAIAIIMYQEDMDMEPPKFHVIEDGYDGPKEFIDFIFGLVDSAVK